MINILILIVFVIIFFVLWLLKEMIESLKEFSRFRRIEVDNEIVLLKAQTEYLLKTVESLKIENSNLSIEIKQNRIKEIDSTLAINELIKEMSTNMNGAYLNIDKRFSLTAQGFKSIDDRFKIVADSLGKVDNTIVKLSWLLMNDADRG